MYNVTNFNQMPNTITRHGKRWIKSNVFSSSKYEMEKTIKEWERKNIFPGWVSIIVPYMSHYLGHSSKGSLKATSSKMYVIYSREAK